MQRSWGAGSCHHGTGPSLGTGGCPGPGPQARALCGDKGPIDGPRRSLQAGSDIWGLCLNFFLGWPEPGGWSRDAEGPLHRPPVGRMLRAEAGGRLWGSPSCQKGCAGRDGCTLGLALDCEGAVGSRVPRARLGHPLGVPRSPIKPLCPAASEPPWKSPNMAALLELIFNISLASESSKFPPTPQRGSEPPDKSRFLPALALC